MTISEWSEDVCTCNHIQSKHKDTNIGPWTGACKDCIGEHQWDIRRGVCTRYQWNGEPRRRIW